MELLYCLKKFNYDFYFTHDNSRTYVTDDVSLKQFFSNTEMAYAFEEDGECKGIILLWKSKGGGKTRHYVKVTADTKEVCRDLLTILLWNTSQDLFAKIRKSK